MALGLALLSGFWILDTSTSSRVFAKMFVIGEVATARRPAKIYLFTSASASKVLLLTFLAMDSLFAKADAIQPLGKKRKAAHSSKSASSSKSTKPSGKDADDHTLSSIVKRTSTPKSLRIPEPSDASQVKKYSHIANKKLRTELVRQSTHNAQAKEMLADAEMLSMGERGMLEVENEMEKTWRVGQSEIASSAGGEAAKGKQEWKLDGGPYKSRYTKNGRLVHEHLLHPRCYTDCCCLVILRL